MELNYILLNLFYFHKMLKMYNEYLFLIILLELKEKEKSLFKIIITSVETNFC